MFHDDLLMRTAVGYEPTLQGQRLIEELKVFLPRLDRLLSGSAFDPEVEQARFRIAATEHAASIVAPALCREVLPSGIYQWRVQSGNGSPMLKPGLDGRSGQGGHP
jgi:DNA-binding transcriptional LysR family regulator